MGSCRASKLILQGVVLMSIVGKEEWLTGTGWLLPIEPHARCPFEGLKLEVDT